MSIMDYEPLERAPEWHARAKCAQPGVAPRDYDLDVDRGEPRRQQHEQMVRAARACLGCPVVRECAREAVHDKSRGVIRGGQPCPSGPWHNKDNPLQAALHRVAAGDDPLVVAAYTAACLEYTWSAVRPLAALVAARYPGAGIPTGG